MKRRSCNNPPPSGSGRTCAGSDFEAANCTECNLTGKYILVIVFLVINVGYVIIITYVGGLTIVNAGMLTDRFCHKMPFLAL